MTLLPTCVHLTCRGGGGQVALFWCFTTAIIVYNRPTDIDEHAQMFQVLLKLYNYLHSERREQNPYIMCIHCIHHAYGDVLRMLAMRLMLIHNTINYIQFLLRQIFSYEYNIILAIIIIIIIILFLRSLLRKNSVIYLLCICGTQPPTFSCSPNIYKFVTMT
jgi:hypothetical protein